MTWDRSCGIVGSGSYFANAYNVFECVGLRYSSCLQD